jgi:pseudaminic acid synthase
MEITIGDKKIGPGNPTFIIGELSGNHNQDYGRAIEIIDAAIDAGVDAIKLQTYTSDTHTIDCDKDWFKIGKGTIWEGSNIYDLYKTTYTPWEWQPKLKEYVESKGKILFSAVTDTTSIKFLVDMGVPIIKVASFELPDLRLLAEVGKTKLPVILSRGMASEEEITDALKVLRENGAGEIILLHCVSAYPAPASEMNLATIPDIVKKFEVISGLSDHTLGITIPVAAAALGASVIEKHICLRRADGGADSAFSLEPEELKEMVSSVRSAEAAIGVPTYEITEREKSHSVFKRSLFVVQDVKKGEPFTEENIRTIRPGYGIAPKHIDQVIGKHASCDIERGTPVSWDLIT